MQAYAKILLYTYPLLERVGEDYEEHVRNKAVLSYRSNRTAEELAEYLAGEILEMRCLEWLKGRLDEAFAGLSEEEKLLLRARYFGKDKSGERLWGKEKGSALALCERTYFRRLARAEERLARRLKVVGLTEKEYEERLAAVSIVKRVAKKVEKLTPPFRTEGGGAALR